MVTVTVTTVISSTSGYWHLHQCPVHTSVLAAEDIAVVFSCLSLKGYQPVLVGP
jgi:hypothetical protein